MNKKIDLKAKNSLSAIIIMTIIFFIISLLSFIGSRIISNTEYLSYQEASNIDYSVCFKQPNDFYDDRCLPSTINQYVTRYIDYINVNFDYRIQLNKKVNISYKYRIIGELTIHDRHDPTSVKNRREYPFLPQKEQTLNKVNELKISELIKLDYDEYNDFVNEYKQHAAILAGANLKAIMYIDLIIKYDPDDEIPIRNEIAVNIPLGESSIQLGKEFNPSDTVEDIEVSSNDKLINQILFYLSLVTFLLTIILGIRIVLILYKKHKKTPIYIRFINKIRKKFDVDITNLKSLIDTDKENKYTYLDVTNFKELYEKIKKSNNKQIYWNEKVWEDKKGNVINRITWFFIFIDDKKVVRFIVDENEITAAYEENPKVIRKYWG